MKLTHLMLESFGILSAYNMISYVVDKGSHTNFILSLIMIGVVLLLAKVKIDTE